MTTATGLDLLRSGELTVTGRLTAASNATFQGVVSRGVDSATVVYKPIAGERPLWDFPDGTLAQREFAAYLVSEALGWHVVPPTLLRDGPYGEGMCQLWIDESPDHELVDIVPEGDVPDGWVGVLDAYDGRHNPVTLVHSAGPGLQRMAVFDVIVNNADRKGGHILSTATGAVHGVDHGVTFNADEKLRTVLWGWAGDRVPDTILADVRRLLGSEDPARPAPDASDRLDGTDQTGEADERVRLYGGLGRRLAELITPAELDATRARCRLLLTSGRFPLPSEDWPAIPWPAF